MKIAVIDMGTNTFHLLIVEVDGDDFKILFREKTAVKIGEKGINEGRINSDAIQRALKALKRFKETIQIEKTDQVFATATSAIRNAENGQELVKLIKDKTGIDTRIISGLQEAEYIYFGVKRALNMGTETSLIMDIGGGSIEFIIGNQSEIFWKQSFEIGGQRMMEKFHEHDPITFPEIDRLHEYLGDHLGELFEKCKKYRPTTLIGSSGTFDTLSDIYRMRMGEERTLEQTELPLTLESFKEIFDELLKKDREQRLQIPGMIALRVDMIVVATVLIAYVLKKCDLSKIRVSAYALKEGVLLNTLHSLKKGQKL